MSTSDQTWMDMDAMDRANRLKTVNDDLELQIDGLKLVVKELIKRSVMSETKRDKLLKQLDK